MVVVEPWSWLGRKAVELHLFPQSVAVDAEDFRGVYLIAPGPAKDLVEQRFFDFPHNQGMQIFRIIFTNLLKKS